MTIPSCLVYYRGYNIPLDRRLDVNQYLLTTKEAARHLGVSKAFLERDRWAGARIPFIKVGSRTVRYRITDLDAYVNGNVCMSTSQGS